MKKEKLKINVRMPKKIGNSMKPNWVRLYLLGDIDHLKANVYVIFNPIPKEFYQKKPLQLTPKDQNSFIINCDFPISNLNDSDLTTIQCDCYVDCIATVNIYSMETIVFSAIPIGVCDLEEFTNQLYRSLQYYNYHNKNSIVEITMICRNENDYLAHCEYVNLLYTLNRIY